MAAPPTHSFFEHQHLARRNTKILVLMYALAVIGVILAVDLVLAGTYAANFVHTPPGKALTLTGYIRAVPPSLYVLGALGTALVVFAVSGWNVLQLASGGKAVAEMIGARRVAPDTGDPLERRLVNVVEEMAIASGVRVPAVYVMDGEPGINAFAAGYDVSNSVVAVTRGTLETLNRDELQGVIGHEFSHILNGDMRLNIRMIGVLAGIVFIGSVGQFLMRSQRNVRDSRGAMPIFAAGLALLVIGYIGLFFARLIKAAVSRQREFLADASSVQFTRNPDGIAGALDQIGIAADGALIRNRHAEDMSHMFFGQGIQVRLSGLFDTHPPLEERIQRAHPRFDRPSYRKTRAGAEAEIAEPAAEKKGVSQKQAATAVLGAAAAMPGAGRRGADAKEQWGRSAGESARIVGSLDGAKVDYAARLLAALPGDLRERLRAPEGAGAALVALLLAPKDDVMQAQLAALRAAGLAALAERALAAAPLSRRLGAALHMPVIDLALPALKSSADASKSEVLRALETVINADRRVSLHEFVVLTLVRNQLAPKGKPGAAGSRKLAELNAEAMVLLSLVAHAGTRQDASGQRGEALQAAMRAGAKEMGLPEAAPAAALTLEAAGAALAALKALAPMQKALLVKGLFAAVSADGTIRVMEAELMRLVGAVLDCPLPPLLESVDPATLAA
ncbi:MAG: M48 family metallopeptidase [Betaproteobacteria bacterium]|nr:M48 family metallopeptidase [Betaproteobacteria bacterium]